MNILFIFAHPDDEAFGPAGTIAKLSKNHNVYVASLCRGDTPTRPEVSEQRIAAFKKSCRMLGAEPHIFDSSDVNLEYNDAMRDVSSLMRDIMPDVVYTMSPSDVHKDHRLVSEVVMVACRPTLSSTVKELYHCELPTAGWAFDQFQPQFIPNVYVNVDEYMNIKYNAMCLYETELYSYPDARSTRSMEVLAEYRGNQVGLRYAEAFKLIYKRD
jgi:LmbE family N-acetylglucosaminyl deacetylase